MSELSMRGPIAATIAMVLSFEALLVSAGQSSATLQDVASITTPTQSSEPASCQITSTPPECSEGQMPVLVVSDSSCSWVCNNNPHYKKATNSKPTVIGGSVGAVAFVLLVLATILAVSRYKRKKLQRAVYIKDTADLASELSDMPLLYAHHNQQHLVNGVSFSSNSSSASSRIRSFFGLKKDASLNVESNLVNIPLRAPESIDSGTAELLMDIAGRAPDDDPTLASVDGAQAPFRQEKTANAYPLLLEFSYSHTAVSKSCSCLPYSVESNASVNRPRSKPVYALQKQRSMARRLQRPVSTDCVDLSSHGTRLIRDYEAAKSSGDAAIESIRKSALSASTAAVFDPFHAIPNIRSTPYRNESRSMRSSRTSSKTSSSSHE